MMKQIAALLISTSLLAPASLAMSQDDVRRCKAMASTFKVKTAEFEAAKAVRDDRAVLAEDTGEAWENAEALRAFDAAHAETADAAKTAHQEARAAFSRAEMAVRSQGRMLNDDIAAYNASCQTK